MATKQESLDNLYIDRVLNLPALLEKKSLFLLGPRQTGKTSLIRHTLKDAKVYDLLDTSVFLAMSQNPGRLAQELTPKNRFVVIDEIQRLPILLNEVHRLIEDRRIRFLLTGSSARKLRRGGVNLLGGRARTKYLHPLTYRELGQQFDLFRALKCGLIPSIYFSDNPRADLQAYTGSYLQQEIIAEGATRNVPAFSRFLKVAALCNGTIVNFTNVANDAQVPRTTVYEYFEILKDTLVIHELPAWRSSVKRKPLVSSKYYFFDVGVAATLQGRAFMPGTPEFGEAFETYFLHELRSYSDYVSAEPLSYWRSTSGFEVDFILGDHTAIEVKAKENVSSQDLKSLRALAEEKKLKRYLCISLEARARTVEGITILPYRKFLDDLWSGAYSSAAGRKR
ncbi:MAG: ATP-binding protein [Thermodesulfovibrionales bacterium]|nr:ATP-binding protein [Nitrospinota bacterium]MCG2778493.1 ATP-binding protein [Desulfobacterales bacterium]MDP3048950.1 ATP-binding protein [Thermodesulfovibrionales bacterium]